MKGASALLLGGFLASCSHEEFDISTYVADKVKAYEQVFVNEFGSIDPNQDWGFGSVSRNIAQTKGLTRAVGTWTLNHNDDWMSYLEFTTPTDYIEVKEGVQLEGSNTYYVPNTFTGTLSFKDNFAGKIYIDTDLTGFTGNNLGNVSVYILENGSWTLEGISTGNITIYNNGTLALGSWAWQNQNIKTVYNGGNVKIGKAGEYPNFADGVSLYSNSTGLVEIYGANTDLKLACDIHGTMKVYGDLKIQNGRTQYICGLEVSGTLDMTQGKLETSYVEATDIKFDGAHIWLLPQGHIVAKNQISMPNSASEIYGHEGSYALVETKNFYLRNHNNFADTFSSNIYFKVSGTIDIQERITSGNGQVDDVTNQYTVAQYIESQNGKAVANRFTTQITVNPVCGDTGGSTPEPGPGDDEDLEIPIEDPTVTNTTIETYETHELIESGRVFCEDLGNFSRDDMDFNDVVFDAYIYKVTTTQETKENDKVVDTEVSVRYDYDVFLLAAGGTISVTVAGESVHNAFGESDATLINTATSEDNAFFNPWTDGSSARRIQGESDDSITINDIPIIVQYPNGTVLQLEAFKGVAPHKICVPIGTKWSTERNAMAKAYPNFNKGVQEFWTSEGEGLHADLEYNYSIRSAEPKWVGTQTGTSSSEGGYNGTGVLSRPRK